MEAGRPWTANQVPFVRRAAKEEEEEEAREEVREKRRGTSASLAAGSTAREELARRGRHGEAARDRRRQKHGEKEWKGTKSEGRTERGLQTKDNRE